MIIFIFCLLLFMVYKAELAPIHLFHKDYLSHKNTTLINGVFVILVYLSHSSAKCNLNHALDIPYISLKQHLLQLVVVTFLFYSGYGMCESMKRKSDYIQSIFKKRLPMLFIHFNIAIALYLLVQKMLGKTYGILHILKASIGFSSVGNSNWYIFVILLLYIFMIVAGLLTKNKWIRVHIMTLLVMVYITIMVKMNMPTRFYNTVLCFNLGMYYSLLKDKIDAVVMKNQGTYLCCLFVSMLLYWVCYRLKTTHLIYYILWTFVFMNLVLLFSMKVKMNNPLIHWFGSNIFGIYILQRIPINILCSLKLQSYPYMFVMICLLLTVIMTILFNLCLKKVDHFIFERK